jgi:hypothetical protein
MTSVEKSWLLSPNATAEKYQSGKSIGDVIGPDQHPGHDSRSFIDGAAARLGFLENEVDPLWLAHREPLLPDGESYDDLLIGRWRKHTETGLFVRAANDGIVLAKGFDRAFDKGRWFYAWRTEDSRHNNFAAERIKPSELTMASGLVTDFEKTLNNYLPQYA